MLAARTRSSYSSFALSLYCNQNGDFNQIAKATATSAVVDAQPCTSPQPGNREL